MSLWRAGILGVLLVLAAGPAFALGYYFECPENRYLEVSPGQTHQFASAIQALPPGNTSVEVRFRPRLPANWSATWTLQSTGETFFGDGQVELQVGIQDRLFVDVTTEYGVPDYGWIDVTIQSIEDPWNVAHCTYTVYAGMPIPPVDWDIDCTNSTLYVQEPWAYFEIQNPLVNRLPVTDTLLVRMEYTLPYMWGMHFHHNGICYPVWAELPIPANSAPDSMIVMGGIGDLPGMGAGEMILQSKRNPSLARYCHYRVIYDAPEGNPASPPTAESTPVRVAPNPSAGEATFFLRQAAETAGTLSIFATDGRLVRSFPRVALAQGSATVRWDGRDQQGGVVSPGIYFYRFGSGSTASRGTIVRTQ